MTLPSRGSAHKCTIKTCWILGFKPLPSSTMTATQTEQPSCITTPGQDPTPHVHNFVVSTIIPLFSSSGPAGDWLKLVVIGGILELLRRCILFGWRNVVNQFWITVAFEEYSDSYCECHYLIHLQGRFMITHSLDDDVVVQTARMDRRQGALDQQPFIRDRSPRRPGRRRSGRQLSTQDQVFALLRLLDFFVVSGSLYPHVEGSSLRRSLLHERSSNGQVSTAHNLYRFPVDADELVHYVGSSPVTTKSSTNYCSTRRMSGKPQRRNRSQYTHPTPRTSGD